MSDFQGAPYWHESVRHARPPGVNPDAPDILLADRLLRLPVKQVDVVHVKGSVQHVAHPGAGAVSYTHLTLPTIYSV